MPVIESTDLKEQMTAALTKARDIADLAEREERDFTPEERQQVSGYLNEAKDLRKKWLEADADADLRSQITNLGDGIDLLGGSASPKLTPVRGNLHRTPAEDLIESPGFQRWLNSLKVGESIPDRTRVGNSPPIIRNDLLTGAGAASAGALVISEEKALVPLGRRPLTVRDIITNSTTRSDTVEYPRVLTETNNAAPVAEATATSGGSGVKPESAITFERVTETVKTIAHWVPATKRALSDAGQLRTYIDGFLRDGLEQELEDQIVGGDGTGQNFTGIANVTGVQAQAWDTSLLKTTREARTLVRVVGRARATAYLLNPYDWEAIDLLQDAENRYYFGGPMQLGTPVLWGLPVVESEAVTQGIGYVGDFRQCVLWDREETTIQVSDSHSDFFIRNMVAILAELRAAFGVLRPAAIVEMDLTA